MLGGVWRAALLVELGRVLKADEPQMLLNLCKALSNRSKRATLHAGCAYRLLDRHRAAGPGRVYAFVQHNEAYKEQVCIGKSTVHPCHRSWRRARAAAQGDGK